MCGVLDAEKNYIIEPWAIHMRSDATRMDVSRQHLGEYRRLNMADNFTVTKTEKETKTGKTITIDIKRTDSNSRTISGDIEDVVAELKKLTEKD